MSSGNSTVIETDLSITSQTTTEIITSTTTTTTIESTTTETSTTPTTTTTTVSEPTSTTTSTEIETSTSTSTPPPTTTSTRTTETTETKSETETSTNDNNTTVTVTITSTDSPTPSDPTNTNDLTTATTTTSAPGETGGLNSGGSVSSGFSKSAVIAIGVIVPVVVLAVVGVVLVLYFKKRKNKRNTSSKGFIGSGLAGGGAPPPDGGRDGTFEMNETDNAGYRGWGSTAGGRKSTVAGSSGYPMSSVGKAVSDGGYSNPSNPSNPTSVAPPGYLGNVKEVYGGMNMPHSPTYPDSAGLLGVDRTAPSPAFTESSTIGAMPTFDSHNTGGLNRGVSNASSNYSTMSHSDQSDYDHRQSQRYYGTDAQDYDASYFANGPNMYYDESSNPPPVIRDVQARRNTRIETPTSAHFPQHGSSGIAQNF